VADSVTQRNNFQRPGTLFSGFLLLVRNVEFNSHTLLSECLGAKRCPPLYMADTSYFGFVFFLVDNLLLIEEVLRSTSVGLSLLLRPFYFSASDMIACCSTPLYL